MMSVFEATATMSSVHAEVDAVGGVCDRVLCSRYAAPCLQFDSGNEAGCCGSSAGCQLAPGRVASTCHHLDADMPGALEFL
jgi:hypothetical protein